MAGKLLTPDSITTETTTGGRTRYRIQVPNLDRPGRYRSRRWDDRDHALRFVDNARLYGLAQAIETDDALKGKGERVRATTTMGLGDYIEKIYLPTRKKHAPGTKDSKATHLQRIRRNKIAAIPMCDITVHMLEEFVGWLEGPGARKSGDRPLGTGTQAEVLKLVRAAITYAVKARDILEDPMPKELVPAIEVTDQVEPVNLEVDEFWEIATCLPSAADRALFSTMFYSGIRIGEAVALCPEHVTPVQPGVVEIRIVDGKTPNAKRKIQIPADALAGADLTKDGRIWPMNVRTYRKHWRQAWAKAGYTRVRPHDLRHSHAAFLMEAEVNPINISRHMGHANLHITERMYPGVTEESRVDTSQKVIALMASRKRKRQETA